LRESKKLYLWLPEAGPGNLLLINHIPIIAVSGKDFANIYRRIQRESPVLNIFILTMANDLGDTILDNSTHDTRLLK